LKPGYWLKTPVECKKCGYVLGEVSLMNWEEEVALLIDKIKVCPKCGHKLSKNPEFEIFKVE